ncbi:ATP-binding protein [Streptomyces sp. NPDC006309]|uniref:ATP-binding protein n=1 Tax=Streptomyces sp. NPDC006309 TaxID=3156749 RepID=UPI0033A6D64F
MTLLATAMFAGALIVAGVGLLAGLHTAMVQSLDGTARERLKDVSSIIKEGRLGSLITSNHGDIDVTLVLAPDGEVIASSYAGAHTGGDRGLPFPLPAELGAGRLMTLTDLRIGDTGDFRVAAEQTRVRGRPATIVVAMSLRQAERTLSLLQTILLAGIPVLTALAGWMLWLTAGRTLRPVETLRRQATEITATDLHRRLDVPDSHDEVHALAVTLNEMLTRLDVASAAQRRFVGDAAHELRSPLAAIHAQLEALANYPDPQPDAQVASALLEDTERLHDLVEGLLDLARAEGPAPQRLYTVVDLDEVVFAEARRQRALTERVIDTRSVSAGRVRGDAHALRRVVRNLLDNARRHAKRHIRIALNRRQGTVELVISDDGAGIPPADRERVFERFTRLDEARSREVGGSGLGLAIVSGIVMAHGGTVRAEADDAPGQGGLGGARLLVRLPEERES